MLKMDWVLQKRSNFISEFAIVKLAVNRLEVKISDARTVVKLNDWPHSNRHVERQGSGLGETLHWSQVLLVSGLEGSQRVGVVSVFVEIVSAQLVHAGDDNYKDPTCSEDG